MTFNVRITFTGLCTLVPHLKDEKAPRDKRKITGAAFVLPNGRQGENNPAHRVPPLLPHPDNREELLRLHRAFLQFPLRHLCNPPGIPTDSDGLWYLQHERLTFEFTSGKHQKIDLSPDQLQSALGHAVPEMDQVLIPSVGNIDSACLRIDPANPPPQDVIAQIFFEDGRFEVEDKSDRTPAIITPMYPGKTKLYELDVTEEIYLIFDEVTCFTVVGTSFDGLTTHRLPLQAPANETIELTIGNLCYENPLRWPPLAAGDKEDVDFKWYYEFLPSTSRTEVRKELTDRMPPEQKTLPIPVVITAAGGDNCIPNQVRAQTLAMP